jgi:hypothetical protein
LLRTVFTLPQPQDFSNVPNSVTVQCEIHQPLLIHPLTRAPLGGTLSPDKDLVANANPLLISATKGCANRCAAPFYNQIRQNPATRCHQAARPYPTASFASSLINRAFRPIELSGQHQPLPAARAFMEAI